MVIRARLKTRERQGCGSSAHPMPGRLQMAEGYLKARYGDRYRPVSAGMEPGSINPLTIRVMEETGIDIRSHRSKTWHEFGDRTFDVIVIHADLTLDRNNNFPGQEPVYKKNSGPAVMTGGRGTGTGGIPGCKG